MGGALEGNAARLCLCHCCTCLQIPVTNSGAAPLSVVADCRGDAFSGPRTFEVPPGMTLGYPLTFSAPWIGDYAGALEMSFPATGAVLLAVCMRWRTSICALSCVVCGHAAGSDLAAIQQHTSVYSRSPIFVRLSGPQCNDSGCERFCNACSAKVKQGSH